MLKGSRSSEEASRRTPFIRIKKFVEAKQPMIQFTPIRGTPICSRISLTKVQLTLSKDLIRSSLSKRDSIFFVFNSMENILCDPHQIQNTSIF